MTTEIKPDHFIIYYDKSNEVRLIKDTLESMLGKGRVQSEIIGQAIRVD